MVVSLRDKTGGKLGLDVRRFRLGFASDSLAQILCFQRLVARALYGFSHEGRCRASFVAGTALRQFAHPEHFPHQRLRGVLKDAPTTLVIGEGEELMRVTAENSETVLVPPFTEAGRLDRIAGRSNRSAGS